MVKLNLFIIFCKNVFLGGSIINHGGQNPLEKQQGMAVIFYTGQMWKILVKFIAT